MSVAQMCSEYPYAVVEFPFFHPPFVEAVPSAWIFDANVANDGSIEGKSYWPKLTSKVVSWIKRQKTPVVDGVVDHTQWEIHRINVLRYCNSLSHARQKRDKAMNDDILTSETDVVKRKRTVPKRFLSESSDSDCGKGPPLKITRIEATFDSSSTKKTAQELECPAPKSVLDSDSDDNDDCAKSPSKLLTPALIKGAITNNFTAKTSQSNENQQRDTQGSTAKQTLNSTAATAQQLGSTVKGDEPSSSSAPATSCRRRLWSPRKTSCASCSSVSRELTGIKTILHQLTSTVNKIWAVVAPSLQRPPSDGFPKLPLTNLNGVQEWEAFLKKDDNFYSAVNLLATYGLNTCRESIYSICRAILTDEVAVNFNMKGTRRERTELHKRSFMDLLSYKLIKVAYKKHVTDFKEGEPYNNEHIKNCVARWLKDSPARAPQ